MFYLCKTNKHPPPPLFFSYFTANKPRANRRARHPQASSITLTPVLPQCPCLPFLLLTAFMQEKPLHLTLDFPSALNLETSSQWFSPYFLVLSIPNNMQICHKFSSLMKNKHIIADSVSFATPSFLPLLSAKLLGRVICTQFILVGQQMRTVLGHCDSCSPSPYC